MVLYYSLEVAEVFITIDDVLGNVKVFLVVFYCSLEVAERVISIAEVAIGTSFSGPVADVLGNANVFLVILYCSLEKHCRDCH